MQVTELTGSDTYVHFETMGERWIALVPGLANFAVGERLTLNADPKELFCFDADGQAATPSEPAPARAEA